MTFLARTKKKLYLVVVRYFRFFANISIRRWDPRVVVVTGSVGKTTLLNLLEVQLGDRAHYSHNANSSYGIAFDILGLDGVRGSKFKWLYLFIAAPLRSFWFSRKGEFYVVEVDGERPGETKFLAEWLRPEVTLWVSVGRTHAVYFDGQVHSGLFDTVEDAIVHEFSYLPKNTQKMVVFDSDNTLISKTMESIDGVDGVGVDRSMVGEYKVWPDKTEITVGSIKYTFTDPVPKEVYVQLAILARFAEYLGEDVVTDLSRYVQPPGRSNFFKGKNKTKLIDSTYNAHLISMRSVVELYRQMKSTEKWIVIGDIVEQGEAEADEHTSLGGLLRSAEFDRYILVGRRTQKYTYPEMDPLKTVTFLHPRDAAKYLSSELSGGETVLFKGSQYLEGVVEYLLEDPEDTSRLPRQEVSAKRRRRKWGL